MAIERDMGAGGLPDIPMLPEDDMQIDLMELPDQPEFLSLMTAVLLLVSMTMA
jgi:hypothetical protein